MARKDRIIVQRTDSLADIDEELDLALDRLAGINEKVGEVLASMGIAPDAGAAPSGEPVSPALEPTASDSSGEEG
jgi:hypothetical protein